MKKIILIVLIIVPLFLSSCGKNSKTDNPSNQVNINEIRLEAIAIMTNHLNKDDFSLKFQQDIDNVILSYIDLMERAINEKEINGLLEEAMVYLNKIPTILVEERIAVIRLEAIEIVTNYKDLDLYDEIGRNHLLLLIENYTMQINSVFNESHIRALVNTVKVKMDSVAYINT